jgi:Transposase IS200 like
MDWVEPIGSQALRAHIKSAGGAADVSPMRKHWELVGVYAKRRRCGTMSHSYSQNVVHVVFRTKNRAPLISTEFQLRLWAYIVGVCKKQGIHVLAVGGMEDHIHLLFNFPRSYPLQRRSSRSRRIPRNGRTKQATNLPGRQVMRHSV